MAAKVVKLAVIPAALGLGLASFRVYALSKGNKEEPLSPQELSIYACPTQNLRYVEEQPGFLQRTFGWLRVGLQPYARTVEGTSSSVKAEAANVYRAGQDAYRFLKDPSPGFLPKLSVITVSGLTGLVLARKGSRLKRLGMPLGMAAVSTAVCYPAQTVGVLKLMGKKVYPASQWTSSAVTSLWKTPSVAKKAIIPSTIPEDVPVPGSEVREPTIKSLPKVEPAEEALLSSDDPTSIPAPVVEVTSGTGSEVETSSITAEATSQPLKLEPLIPVGPESVPTHIPEPELLSIKEFASPPILEPQLPSGHAPLPPSIPESEGSSMKESVSPPIPEPELPTMKESIPLAIPELELPSGLESVLPTMPEPELPTLEASVSAPILEPELSTGGESAPAPIPEPEPASLPSLVSLPVKEPLPLFEPKFEPKDEPFVPLEPEPEPKVTVTAESGPVQESAFALTSEPELAAGAALVHVDELLPILAAPDPVELPDPPFLETPNPVPEVDTFAEESALPADMHSAFVDEEPPEFPPSRAEENGPGPLEEKEPFIVEAIVPQSSGEADALEEAMSPSPSLTESSTHLSIPPMEINIPDRPVQEASPLYTNGKSTQVEEVILPTPAADPSPLEPSVATEKRGFPAESELADHGQAEPEDADLYSTRS